MRVRVTQSCPTLPNPGIEPRSLALQADFFFFKLLKNLQIQPVFLEVELLYYFRLVSLTMKTTQVMSELCKCKAMILFGNVIV